MWTDERLIELLGLEHPIIQAPMAGAATPSMAAAAANAGCLGSLGCALMTPEQYHAAFDELRGATNRAVNMNFFCHEPPRPDAAKAALVRDRMMPIYERWDLGEVPRAEASHHPFDQDMLEAVIATNPGVVSFHFGLPDQDMLRALKDAGMIILASATTPAEASDLQARGADGIVAQGWEAGGHHGFYLAGKSAQIGTMALVPQIVDAVNVPVIAAGGIADGRGIAAALALGASGVQIGTAFLTTDETGVPDVHKEALLAAESGDTAVTRLFSGRPARGVVNKYMEEMASWEDSLPDFPIMNTLTGPLRKASGFAESPDYVALWSGQAVGLNTTGTTEQLIGRLVDEARQALARLNPV